MINKGITEVCKRQSTQGGHGVVGAERAAAYPVEQQTYIGLIHAMHAATAKPDAGTNCWSLRDNRDTRAT